MKRALSILVALVFSVALTGCGKFASQPSSSDQEGTGEPTAAESSAPPEKLVLENNPKLNEGSEATLVEFLDFSCEACGQLYPYVEEIRKEYGDQITFVVRYFNTEHTNSSKAFQTAEAARQQGKFEEMYKRLFETQKEWGESPDDMEDRFFGYAQDLGLDMDKFRAAYSSKEVADYIASETNAGRELGVSGTPTYYLDGKPLELQKIEDLRNAVRDAVEN